MADDLLGDLSTYCLCGHVDYGWYYSVGGEGCPLCRAKAEIKRLRAENAALYEANHQAMWDDTLIPIANALGVAINDEYGIPRRQFQMVDAIIKEARRG